MKFFVVGFLLFSVAVANAQQASPELQTAAIQAVQAQRNAALDQAAGLAAQLQVTTKELNDLKAADAKKAEADKKPEPQK